jgi:hypothetical protein
MRDMKDMVREAGCFDATPEFLERFAALVRADEREACAELADRMDACQDGEIGKAIRARGNT